MFSQLSDGPFDDARHMAAGGIAQRAFGQFRGAIDAFLEAQQPVLPLFVPLAFGTGILLWFAAEGPGSWLWLMALCSLGILALCLDASRRGFAGRRHWLVGLALFLIAAGCGHIWLRSELVGSPAIERPLVGVFTGQIVEREELPARQRVRLVLQLRSPSPLLGQVRINLDPDQDQRALVAGAVIQVRARLMPPASPMLPGGYDFARNAWFKGLRATGSALDAPLVLKSAQGSDGLAEARQQLGRHIRSQMGSDEGGIAVALVTGDTGAISEADTQAMQRSGLAHLLSISGLHVSALIGAVYLILLKSLALWPWLALRVRLPVIAAAGGGLAGISYTVFSGAEVPTVRSCAAALLVLAGLAMGRNPFSLRLIAAGAMLVMLFWPEAVTGPSFQLSFAAVTCIVALHEYPPVKALFARRDEGFVMRLARTIGMLLLTGLAIELALSPIALHHFHQTGLLGALANVVAIPLTTFVIMPAEALALLADLAGLGAPFWWVAQQGIGLLLQMAHITADQPGSVALLPGVTGPMLALFAAGALWLAIIQGRWRLAGLVPMAMASLLALTHDRPDILMSGDGHHVALIDPAGQMYLLRSRAGDYTRESFLEIAGLDDRAGQTAIKDLREWPGAQCNRDFCSVLMAQTSNEPKAVLISRNYENVPERALAAACRRSDIVISERWLPRSCQPRWIKADRRYLWQSGGLAIDSSGETMRSVADSQGRHGWFIPKTIRGEARFVRKPRPVDQSKLKPLINDSGAAAPPNGPEP